MRGPALLALAIVFEVGATLGLKASAGASRTLVVLAVVAGYAAAFACLARCLEILPLGVVYAVWAGVGTVGVALLGRALFGELLPSVAWLGIALVAAGVALLGSSGALH